MSKLRCASFFAGVGGIDLGFEQTGAFEVVYANEVDKFPAKTYRLNFTIEVDERPIEEVKPAEIPDFDCLLAGFPCTDISVAGSRKGLFNEDGTYTRSGLFFELIRIIHIKKPRFIFLENVKNLLGHNKGLTFKAIIQALEGEGYILPKYAVLNACEYGNIPQNRERIYIVAFRESEDRERFEFPEPIDLTTGIRDVVDFANKVDERYYYTEGRYKGDLYAKLKAAMDDETAVYQWRRVYVRKNKSGLIPTLTANQGEGGHNVGLIKTAHGIRKLTPRECFNAQGFPSDYKLPEDLSDARLYKQSGNTVCVPVVRRIAQKIADIDCYNKGGQ